MHFVQLANALLKDEENARDNYVRTVPVPVLEIDIMFLLQRLKSGDACANEMVQRIIHLTQAVISACPAIKCVSLEDFLAKICQELPRTNGATSASTGTST